MKRRHHIITLTLSALVVLSLIISAFASSAAVRDQVRPCPQCSTGRVHYVEQEHVSQDRFSCKHGYPNGYDLYTATEVIKREYCDSCSYENVIEHYVDRVFEGCYGHK